MTRVIQGKGRGQVRHSRNAARLWALQDYILDRASRHGMVSRGCWGIRPRGAYGRLADRVAVMFDRTPIADRQQIYNAVTNGCAA